MDKLDNLVKECINNAPLTALSFNQQLLDKVNSALPYSIGFEIECRQRDDFNEDCFRSIPHILDVSIDTTEQRFRIPHGVHGLICLYHISEQLKLNSELDFQSGIHYHVDCTSHFADIEDSNLKWMLNELDSWGYKGSYNSRQVGSGGVWIRRQPCFGTIEFRIGEMTFDYSLMIKRILHLTSMVRRLKDSIRHENIIYPPLEKDTILDYLKAYRNTTLMSLNNQLRTLENKIKENDKKDTELDKILQITKQRTVGIYD
jgi:hypothetical protein